jgi:hypothetical protein
MIRRLFVWAKARWVMAEKKTVSRLDSFNPGRWMTSPFIRTAEGFLSGRAIITSVGVFTYLNADGSKTRELRPPEEVFDRDSLASMKMKPVVNDHPDEKVTDENVKKYQVGSLGSNPSSTVQEHDWDGSYTDWEKRTDGFHVAIDMIVNNADAINDVLNGKRALSMGYECEIEMAPPGSVWCGMEYDCIQRNIRYNHVAIVDTARAGDAACIRLDSADAVLLIDQNHHTYQEDKTMKKIRIDGVDYDGDERLIQFYQEQKSRADSAEKALETAKADQKSALSTLEAERDTYKERADKAEKDLKEAKALAADPKRIDEAVKAKVILMGAADQAGVEVKDGMSDIEIKKAVVLAKFPSAKLDGKDDVYITARFDAALEALEGEADAGIREVTADSSLNAGSEDRNDVDSAYKNMWKRMFGKKDNKGDK